MSPVCRGIARASGNGRHTCQQLGEFEWFYQVVVGPLQAVTISVVPNAAYTMGSFTAPELGGEPCRRCRVA